LSEGFQRDQIVGRLQAIRVPVLMVRAPAGFVPGQPPLFPDSMMQQMRTYLPTMEEETIPNTTHYTIVLGNPGATRIADLIADFADRCQNKSAPPAASARK